MAIIAGIRSARQRRQTTGHIQDVVRCARMQIETAEQLPDIDALAAASGLSRSYFYRIFKECTGASPYQYHLQLRISRAKEMLRGSAVSIKEIAAVLQFPSVYQFSKIFKRKTGLSPSHYRADAVQPAGEAAK